MRRLFIVSEYNSDYNGWWVKFKLVTGDESDPIGNTIPIVATALSVELGEVTNT